jgi:hypothetical protein
MPRSKHRRKPGEKAVAHPGRGKLGERPKLPPLADNAAANELHTVVEAIKSRTGLHNLPLLAPLANDKER